MRKLTILAAAGSLLALSACVSRGDFNSLKTEVDNLRAQVQAVDAKASQAQADAARCTETCEALQDRYSSGLRK
jgi:outer membrane murein-binding lipoprotein Lpp